LNLTENESKVIEVIKEGQEVYDRSGETGFSDIMVEDIVAVTKLNVRTVKGVLGSLVKKDMVFYQDVNQEYNIYYLTNKARKQFGMEEAD
jgi:predicted transcriptional regulator